MRKKKCLEGCYGLEFQRAEVGQKKKKGAIKFAGGKV